MWIQINRCSLSPDLGPNCLATLNEGYQRTTKFAASKEINDFIFTGSLFILMYFPIPIDTIDMDVYPGTGVFLLVSIPDPCCLSDASILFI